MGVVKYCFAVCIAAVFSTQGESRRLCGIEVEYTGFDPVEALRQIQLRQIQEFEEFKNTISQLKFNLQTDDYYAWQRCLSEYEKEKLRDLLGYLCQRFKGKKPTECNNKAAQVSSRKHHTRLTLSMRCSV
ncbi:uncharacterized protein LOC103506625 [Diaphorina citri]|uniref:Uncharacterized protein LOC103506625 n=1 Tax=Diaphorina citri TaxID=121845 RepID=A0A1S3CWG9_DIACI|nr:uncharacterized protein LOC103506625 [Diaphorina citri]